MTTKVKKMNANDASNAKRLETMRANLARLEGQADAILAKGLDNLTPADRLALLALVNVAYHNSGKIEGCHSIDSTASCEFCERMRHAAEEIILMICGCCYAAADAWKEAAWRRHKLNARILSTVLFTVEELQALDLAAAHALCRFNEDGDTVNATMCRNYLRIAAGRPGTMFGYWYKNAKAIAEGLAAEGIRTRDQLPANVKFIHSSALIGFPAAALWFDDAIFTVYPDQETTEAAIAAGAHACNGRKCRACGYVCYLMVRQEKPLYIAEFLRTNKENRARIRAAYDARKAQENAPRFM